MATIAEHLKNGTLERVEVPLDGEEQPWRMLVATEGFRKWLGMILHEDEASSVGCDLTLAEQLDALLHAYILGNPLHHSRQFHVLSPFDKSVWELKTPDLRIFGWFSCLDTFVALFGAHADKVKGVGQWSAFGSLYPGFCAEVVRIRSMMGCDGECVRGLEPGNVISVRNRR